MTPNPHLRIDLVNKSGLPFRLVGACTISRHNGLEFFGCESERPCPCLRDGRDGWKRGGSVRWQLLDSKGWSLGDSGTADGVPAWSLVSAYPVKNGNFVVLYWTFHDCPPVTAGPIGLKFGLYSALTKQAHHGKEAQYAILPTRQAERPSCAPILSGLFPPQLPL